VSEEFAEAYKEVMKVVAASGPLKKLTWLFSLKTDVLRWKKINRQRREQTKNARESFLTKDNDFGSAAFKSDLIPIKCEGVTFGYSPTKDVLHQVSAEVPQGKLVAVVGQQASGKSTLLRIIGHLIFPESGHVFVPTHLRVLHVSQDPTLLNMGVWKNLTFGRHNADLSRVRGILDRLEMKKTRQLLDNEPEVKIMDQNFHKDGVDSNSDASTGDEGLEAEAEGMIGEGDKWQDTLNYVEKAKLHLARALIVNAEVLVLQRPLIHYDESEGDRITKVIKEHVKNRGLCLPEAGRQRRRPRTCFFSPTTCQEAEEGDIIWRVQEGTLQEISKDALRDLTQSSNGLALSARSIV